MTFKQLGDLKEFKGRRVLLRLDLNLSIVDGRVRDDYRIKRSLKTLEFLQRGGAKTLIVSHIGKNGDASLKPVAEHLEKIIPVKFASSVSELPSMMETLEEGKFILLQNIRENPGEVENNPEFAKTLASFADLYINEAFSVSHREHASIVGVPEFLPSYAGFLFAEEVAHLSKAFNPPKPFVFVLAGDKFETKLPLVKKFLENADTVFVGGALANDLLKIKGYEIGLSKHSDADFGFAEIVANPKVILPVDVGVENQGVRMIKKLSEVVPDDRIFDSGPETVAMIAEKFSLAKFVLWNGTLGVYEKGFKEGTEALAKALSKIKTESIVGGGDTVASISSEGLLDKFYFVSTAGGAMLDFLANETLPGIEALSGGLKV